MNTTKHIALDDSDALTDAEIRRLLIDAQNLGDTETVALCRAALNGDANSRLEIAEFLDGDL